MTKVTTFPHQIPNKHAERGGCGGLAGDVVDACACVWAEVRTKLHRKGGIPDVSEVRQISNSSGQHPRGFAAILSEVRTIFVRCWGYYCKFVRYSDKSILSFVRTCALARSRGRGRCPAGMGERGTGQPEVTSSILFWEGGIPGIPFQACPCLPGSTIICLTRSINHFVLEPAFISY